MKSLQFICSLVFNHLAQTTIFFNYYEYIQILVRNLDLNKLHRSYIGMVCFWCRPNHTIIEKFLWSIFIFFFYYDGQINLTGASIIIIFMKSRPSEHVFIRLIDDISIIFHWICLITIIQEILLLCYFTFHCHSTFNCHFTFNRHFTFNCHLIFHFHLKLNSHFTFNSHLTPTSHLTFKLYIQFLFNVPFSC